MEDALQKIRQLVTENPVVLFMKGTAQFPQCGFSGRAVQVLKACEVKFVTVNCLTDADINAALPKYADWPTLPQCYINGEFIGGSDIMLEMYQAGELQQKLAGVPAAASAA